MTINHRLIRLAGLVIGGVLMTATGLADETEKQLQAANQGDLRAQINLGVHYLYNKETRNDEAAAKWFLMAANQGSAYAQYHLGILSKAGQGVPKDLVAAMMWFQLAALQGNQEAEKNRELLAKLLSPEDLAKARELAKNWQPSPNTQKP